MSNQLIVFLLLAILTVDATKLEVLSVSSKPDEIQNPVYSSLKGGRKVYISVVGHSQKPSDITVAVGPYACPLVDEGVSSNLVVCKTSDSGRSSGSLYYPIYFTSKKQTIQTSYPNGVVYSDSYTPVIKELFPTSGYADQTIAIEGVHRSSDVGSDQLQVGDSDVKIGQDSCNRYNVVQGSLSGGGSNEQLKCKQTQEKQAGKYKITEEVDYGKSTSNQKTKKASLEEDDDFQFTTLPAVEKVTKEGNKGGQEIEIQGSGFSSKPQKNEVSVDGNECLVTESTSTKIKCTLSKKDDQKTSLLQTNSTDQKKGYVSGAGLNYVRYTSVYTSDIFSFVSSIRSSPTAYPKAIQTIMTELKSSNLNGGGYEGQVWKGYFTAPVSGNYTFRGHSQYAFAFYLSEVHGSVDIPSEPLIYSTSSQVSWGNYFFDNVATASASVNMQQGQSFYLEAYHISYYFSGKFKISVEVPNSNANLLYKAYQVDQLITSAEVQPEVVEYSMIGGSGGSINLKLVRTDKNGIINYNQNATVGYGCSDSVFYSALWSFHSFYSYRHSVHRYMYDANGNQTMTVSQAQKIVYRVQFFFLRPEYYQAERFIITPLNYDGTFTQVQVKKHSPLIQGNFSIKVGGIDLNGGNIPYNIDASSLQRIFRSIKGFEKVEVEQSSEYGYEYGSRWVITYYGYNENVPALVTNAANLVGGITSPVVITRTIREYSTSIVFEPVDYRFLNTVSDSPNVLVNVNEIPAVCLTNCSYSFLDLFQIVDLRINGSNLHVTISNPTSVNYEELNIIVKVDGLDCAATHAGNTTFIDVVCSMLTNPDGTPVLAAGNVTPEVYVQNYGYVEPAASVQPIEVPFVVSSLDQDEGSNNGGYLNTIIGTGFVGVGNTNNLNVKLTKGGKSSAQITVTLCDQKAQVKTVANQKVVFYVPQCSGTGLYTVTVSDGTYSNSDLQFNYIGVASLSSLPTITSLSPKTSNPKLKTILNITGEHFGTNISAFRVFLSNSSGPAYQLKVISVNDTLIRCGLSGGLAGEFRVQVNFPDENGDAVAATVGADLFTYSFQIDSISPSNGSYYGGTLLTIKGKNFLTGSGETLVYIGDAINWFCSIKTLTETQITCITPPLHPTYQAGEPVAVLVSSKLTSFSACPGNNCDFTFMNLTDCANLTRISETQTSGGSVVFLYGTNFTENSFCQVSLRSATTNKLTVVPTINCFPEIANFTVPKTLPGGKYYVSIKTAQGDSNPLLLNVSWIIGTISNYAGSVMGAYISFTGGSGYPESLGGDYQMKITYPASVPPVQTISCCQNNTLTLYMPPALSGTAFAFEFKDPLSNYYSVTYQASDSVSYTPSATVVLPSNLIVSAGASSFVVNKGSSTSPEPNNITFVSTINSSQVVVVNSWVSNGSQFNFTADLDSGAYRLVINSSKGFYNVSSIVKVKQSGSFTCASSSVEASFAGGSLAINGVKISKSSYIKVNGFKGKLLERSSSTAKYQIPKMVTLPSQSLFDFAKVEQLDSSEFTFFSDSFNSTDSAVNSFDNDLRSVYASSNPECWVGIDIGQNLTAAVNRIKFFPKLSWKNAADYLLYSKFEGSNDKNSWETLALVDQTVHSGWNVFQTLKVTPFRYVRFVHNSTSQCSLAEIRLFGTVYSNQTQNITTVAYYDGYNEVLLPVAIQFKVSSTPIVNSVTPPYGNIFGGYNIRLEGQNLGFSSTVEVMIDNIPCAYVSNTATELICTVGARSKIPNKNTFTLSVGGKKAIIRQQFMYVLKWSDPTTWGVDPPPIEDDLVYVPPGMTLLVDQSTPKLAGIAVENGTIIFSNDTDVTVKTDFIDLIGGRFIAGTESQPLHSRLTFQMYGGYYGTQQPMAGNKGIFCLQCKFSMFGKPRIKTWTTLENTISPADRTLTLSESVDWQVGESIVVAATGLDHNEAEEKIITSISNKTIFVNTPFKYKHLGVVENHENDKLVMKAEVGLLSRNIKMTGDESSIDAKYGAHLKISGLQSNGLEAKIAYSEFTLCGQPQIPGRFCIYFHMNGEVPTSFVRGNSIHESYARAVTIHGTHLLEVSNNVAYRARGHNFFLRDGTQMHNKFLYNLAVSTLIVSNMLQTDLAPAAFMITNPSNDFIGNRVAGSDFYGFLFELPDLVEGVSAQADICPSGLPLGKVSENVVHSSRYFGMRIKKLYARMYPCRSIRNDSLADDPWQQNPSMSSTFSNFTVFKNGWYGMLAEQVGNIILNNFTVAQNFKSGVEFYVTNFTKEHIAISNSVFVGKSLTNPENSTKYVSGIAGLTTPRTGSTNISRVHFYGFPIGTSALTTCSRCNDPRYFTNLGTELFVSDLYFNDFEGRMVSMLGVSRDVIYDSDGSLSSHFKNSSLTNGTMLYSFPHILKANPSQCFPALNASHLSGMMYCDGSVKIRRVFFTNVFNNNSYYNFDGETMYFVPITNDTEDGYSADSSLKTAISGRFSGFEPGIEKLRTWSLPFVAGQKYQVWWNRLPDFFHLSIVTTTLFKEQDAGIVFKFAYIQNREFFYIGPMRGGVLLRSQNYKPQTATYLTPFSCQNGDYYHSNSNTSKVLEVCQSGKNRSVFEYTEINAVFCKYLCPKPIIVYNSSCNATTKETFVRMWSNASMWPNETVPKAGDNVTIYCDWTVLINVNPEPMGNFIVDGDLVVDDSMDINITAKSIFIRAGSLTVGSPSAPFNHSFIFQINGNKFDNYYDVDPLISGNKLFVVTGLLNLYGKKPSTKISYLTRTSLSGSNAIYVASSSGWAVGDALSLSPSFSSFRQFQEVTISAINADGSITVSPALKYTHYGSSAATVSTPEGTLDARTRVGHLTRGIKIVAGPNSSWGYSLYVYKYYDSTKLRLGNLILNGVQLRNGGKSGSSGAALQFLNVIGSLSALSVVDSSFANCGAHCVNIRNSQNITMAGNILYNSFGAGAQLSESNLKSVTFTGNLISGVSSGTGISACLRLGGSGENVVVKDNVCQGSQGYGFLLPHVACGQILTHNFGNNTAGSCGVGFYLTGILQECQAFSFIKAYACGIGHIAAPILTTNLQYSNFILADNVRGGTLRFGGLKNSMNNTLILNDSHIFAVSRPDCAECYNLNATKCSQMIGLRMLSVSEDGNVVNNLYSTSIDIINKPESIDAKAYLSNVAFYHFRQNYSSGTYSPGVIANCRSNFAFRSNPYAVDATAGHYLEDSPCTGCDNESYIYCDPNGEQYFEFQGGCGSQQCTGKSNYLLQDWTGDFFGFKGVVIPNNTVIGNNELQCVRSDIMNGHLCKREDFVILQYDSRAPDFDSRVSWPAILKGNSSNYTTSTNAWREWQWSYGLPLNKRLNRYLSIVKIHQQYNLTFSSMPPLDLRMQLQKRSLVGNNSNWVMIKIYYPLPNSIRVIVNGQRITPIINTDVSNASLGGIFRQMDDSSCGDNIYFYQNRTIKVLLTEEKDCLVTISVTDSIQLTTHFAMNASDFFTNSVMSNFIDNLCALLGIVDQSRVKVVGVHSGSAIIDVVIEAENGTASAPGADSSVAEIASVLSEVISNGNFSSTMGGAVGYPVISAVSTFSVLPQTVAQQQGGSEKGSIVMLIAAIVGGVIVIVVIFLLIYCVYKKRLDKHDAIVAQDSSDKDNKDVQVNEKEQSHNIIMSDSVFFAYLPEQSSPTRHQSPKKKLKNRRARNRQQLEIKEYD